MFGGLIISLAIFLLIPVLIGNTEVMLNTTADSQTGNVFVYHPQQICSLPGSNISSSIFYSRTTDIKTTDPGVFLEDENNGNLYWCSIDNTFAPGNVTLIGRAPVGFRNGGYYGMGGFDTGGSLEGLVLVLTSYLHHGMWFCYFATLQACSLGESNFISFPKSYCSTLRTGACNPYGTALDSSLDVYWVDPDNAVFSECTSSSNYTDCFTLPYISALSGQRPIGLALIDNTPPYLSPSGWTFYITDNSCTGLVWQGNGTSSYPLAAIAKLNNSLEGIGSTTRDPGATQQIIVGKTGKCDAKKAELIDISNASETVPTKFAGPTSIIGVSVCSGQCLEGLMGARQLYYTFSDNGTVSMSPVT